MSSCSEGLGAVETYLQVKQPSLERIDLRVRVLNDWSAVVCVAGAMAGFLPCRFSVAVAVVADDSDGVNSASLLDISLLVHPQS
jgi:hypothetical protein